MRSKTAIRLLTGVRNTYDSIAADFDRTRQTVWPDFVHFAEHLPESPKILDVGCGNGRLLRYFGNKKFASYLGIDNSSSLLSLAQKQHQGASIRFKTGDALDIPVKAHSYNAVFSVAVLHHIPSRELQLKALSQLSRALADDGLLYLSVWDLYRWSFFPRFVLAFFRWIWTLGDFSPKDLMIPWGRKNPKMRYCHAFTEKELHRLCRDAGLEIVGSYRTSKGRFGNFMVVARPFLRSRLVSVMGVNFHAVTLNEAVKTVGNLLQSNSQHYVVTPNPEILLKARTHSGYRNILNNASLSIPDGIGILWAASFVEGVPHRWMRFIRGIFGLFLLLFFPNRFHRVLPERVTGTDLMEQVTHQSHVLGAKIFLLGASEGVAETVAERWRFDRIVGAYSGSPRPRDERPIIQRVNDSGANLLFVAYGAPSQEEWIVRNLNKMPRVKVAIGVGGAFDFVAGVRRRAPQWMRKVGLEWLWRVAQQPTRIVRIFNATVRFPWHVIRSPK